MEDKRVRYFDGQFLKEEDFTLEQAYHLDRERRPLKSLTVAGVCEGLTVKGGDKKVTVDPGTAIDQDGKQIVLATKEAVDMSQYVPTTASQKEMKIYIKYKETPSDKATLGSGGMRRMHEKPVIIPLGENDDKPDKAVLLALVRVEAQGMVTEVPGQVEYAGFLLPYKDGFGAQIRMKTEESQKVKQGSKSGYLTVTGKVCIGLSASSDKKLHVEGGELYVKGSHNGDDADLAQLLSQDGVQGIGIGKGGIAAIGSGADHSIRIKAKGKGKNRLEGATEIKRGGSELEEKLLVVAGGELLVKGSHDRSASDLAQFMSKNGNHGIGIGMDKIEAIGTAANSSITMKPHGPEGKIIFDGPVQVKKGIIGFEEGVTRRALLLIRLTGSAPRVVLPEEMEGYIPQICKYALTGTTAAISSSRYVNLESSFNEGAGRWQIEGHNHDPDKTYIWLVELLMIKGGLDKIWAYEDKGGWIDLQKGEGRSYWRDHRIKIMRFTA